MGIASRLIGFCLAAGLAAPAFAGDQPVIIKLPYAPINDFGPVYSATGVNPVYYRFDTLTGGTVAAPTSTVATGTSGKTAVARVNAPDARSRGADALYAHVLAEAKSRGLR